jgi:hypothetical protein
LAADCQLTRLFVGLRGLHLMLEFEKELFLSHLQLCELPLLVAQALPPV